jgi:uncharacterized protein (UPF0210 family)
MFFSDNEVIQTMQMVAHERLDIRTVTMGISLLDAPGRSRRELEKHVYDKVCTRAGRLRETVRTVEERYGIPIVNVRISITPMSLVCEGLDESDYVPIAKALDRAAADLGVDYIAGYSALVHKGATPGDIRLIQSLPQVLSETDRICASVNVATTRAGINMDAVRLMGVTVKSVAEASQDRQGIGCAKLVIFANVPEDNPFVAGAFHGIGEPDTVINVGVSGPGVVLAAIRRLREEQPDADCGVISDHIKRMAFKITRAGQLVGRDVARLLGPPVQNGIIDLSLAPTPTEGDSVANILEALGLEQVGTHGTTAALAMLVDAVKKGGIMASSSVGGLSGAFIPVSEDLGMIAAVQSGSLSLDKLEAMTAVCSVGLDMVGIPGDTSADTIAAIIADEMAIGMINHKTIGVRLLPVPGAVVGDLVDYGGLLGQVPIMPVNTKHSHGFISLGGRIPPPITSVRN